MVFPSQIANRRLTDRHDKRQRRPNFSQTASPNATLFLHGARFLFSFSFSLWQILSTLVPPKILGVTIDDVTDP
ncbi:MAG: hypothetical protein ACKOCU_05900, partial [Betaproteobacteria bacterium]